MSKEIPALPENVAEIASAINAGQIAIMPYGRLERRSFAILGSAHNPEVIKRILKVKQRGASDGLAISGIPEAVPMVAELSETPALVTAAKRLGASPLKIVEGCFDIGAIGLILRAQDWLPQETTKFKEGKRSVLVAGETTNEEYDIFPKVYRHLINEYNKVMVGTSANLHGEDSYHILQQEEALQKMGPYVDFFVTDKTHLGFFPLLRHLTSSTILDLTSEKAQVFRWGNLHPDRFRVFFPDMQFESNNLKKLVGREERSHIWLQRILPIKGLLAS